MFKLSVNCLGWVMHTKHITLIPYFSFSYQSELFRLTINVSFLPALCLIKIAAGGYSAYWNFFKWFCVFHSIHFRFLHDSMWNVKLSLMKFFFFLFYCSGLRNRFSIYSMTQVFFEKKSKNNLQKWWKWKVYY